jgi:replication factor A1
MSDIQLSGGVCERLISTDAGEDFLAMPHRLQVLGIKQVANNKGTPATNDRHRFIISDGVHFMQSMLATQLNHLIEQKQIDKYNVIETERLSVNMVQGRRYVFVGRVLSRIDLFLLLQACHLAWISRHWHS